MALHKKKNPMIAMGSYGCVLPFQAIGFEVVVLTNDNIEEVPQLLSQMLNDECAILFFEESFYEKFKDEVEEINEKTSLAIIPIPGQAGSKGIGIHSIRKSVERAVGMDIFSVQ